MKNRSWLFACAALALSAFIAAGFTNRDIQQDYGFPGDVAKLLKNSCYSCHATDARNEDSKQALSFDKWDEYKLTKKISLLNDIDEVLKEGVMPPQKALDRSPEMALTEDQVSVLREWTKKETEILMK